MKDETNEWMLEQLKVKKTRLERMKLLKMGYYGHVIRKFNSLEKEVIRGYTSGSKSRSQQHRRWTQDISKRILVQCFSEYWVKE